MPYLYVCEEAWSASEGKDGSEKRRGTGTKCIRVNLWWKQPGARETKKGTKVYGRYEGVTERKPTEITGASVWSSAREKDSEKERHGRRMQRDTTYIRAETGYKK